MPRDPNTTPSVVFLNQSRERLQSAERREVVDSKIEPKLALIKPKIVNYTLYPQRSASPKVIVYNPPECIMKGNLCEYQIRDSIRKMKKYNQTIKECFDQLQRIEARINNPASVQLEEQDQLRKKKEDSLANQKKKMAELMLDQERLFQEERENYEKLLRENYDEQEIREANEIPDQIRSERTVLNFEQMRPRGELFPSRTMRDVKEHRFNNFTLQQFRGNSLQDFRKQSPRSLKEFSGKSDQVDYLQDNRIVEELKYPHQNQNCLVDLQRASPRVLFNQKAPQLPTQNLSNDEIVLHRTRAILEQQS